MRLDAYLAQHYEQFSRSTWKKFIAQDAVSVNGTVCSAADYEVRPSDIVHFNIPEKKMISETTIPVIYEDESVIVFDKPCGVLTHSKGSFLEEYTVADAVLPKMTTPESSNRPGIVHRLDRDTSGVLIAAKDTVTKRHLQKQFQDRKAKKTYLAVVEGHPRRSEATIDIPLGRNPGRPQTFQADLAGKSAQTYYKVLREGSKYSLVELKPTTGRTHQLRVHMAYIGTPIVGDRLYGKVGIKSTERLYLHAHQLEITIPPSKRVTFTADTPDDFLSKVAEL